MKNGTKAWILFALTLIISAQFTFLGSFYTVNSYDLSTFNRSLIVISKQEYVYARVDVTIGLPVSVATGQPVHVTLIFPNGTQTNITADYRAQLVFPSNGNFFGNAAEGGMGVNISQDHPLDAEVVSNISSMNLSPNGTPVSGLYSSLYGIQVYWIEVVGQAEVTIQGFGFAF